MAGFGITSEPICARVEGENYYIPLVCNRDGYLAIRIVNTTTATTPFIYTIELTSANTEYSVALPTGTRQFSMQPRTMPDGSEVTVRFAFEPGKVATPTEPYATMKNGAPYNEYNLYCGVITIYLASSTAGAVVEIVGWT